MTPSQNTMRRLTSSLSASSSSRLTHDPPMWNGRPSCHDLKKCISAPFIKPSHHKNENLYSNWRVSGFAIPPPSLITKSNIGTAQYSNNQTLLRQWYSDECRLINAMDKNAPSGRSLAQRKEEAVTKIFVMKSARRKCDESQASGSAEANRTPYRQALLGEPDALSELKDILLLEAKRKRLDNDYQDLSSGARPQRRDYDETCARMYKDHELYLLRLDRMASQLGVSGGKSKEPAGSDRSLCPSVRPSRSSAAWSNASCNTVSTNTSSLSRSNAVKVESRNGRPQISEQIAQGRFSIPPWPTNNTLSRPPSLPSLDTKTLFKGKPLVMDYPPNLQTACSSNTAINDSNSSDDQPVLSSSTANSANDPPTASSPTTPFVTGPTTQLLLTAAPTDEEEFEEIDYFPRQPTLYSTSATPWNSQGFIYTPLSESASEAGSSRAKAPASNVGDTSTKTWEDIDLSSVSHWFDEDQMDRSTRPSISNSLKSAFDSASRFARDTKNEFVRYADSHWQGFLSKAGSGM